MTIRRGFAENKNNSQSNGHNTTTKDNTSSVSSSATITKSQRQDEARGEESPRVTYRIDSDTGICYVQLNRPNKLNAVDLPMFESIADTVHRLLEQCTSTSKTATTWYPGGSGGPSKIRAVIVSGNGRSFCTGLDVTSIMKSVKNVVKTNKKKSTIASGSDDGSSSSVDTTTSSSLGPFDTMERLLERPSGYGRKQIGNLAQDVAMLWRELPVPVIAVVHGHCYGAGLQIALGADFRYCHPDTKFSVMEGKWGLIPDMGASVLLRETVGRMDVCKELTMTGRIVNGEEAYQLGLVTHVCTGNDPDPMKEATLLAQTLVERSPDALAATKQLYQNTWTMSESDALIEETRLQRKLLVTWNQLAASGRSVLGWNIPYTNRKD